MPQKYLVTAVAGVLLILAPARAEDKADQQAREAVNQFMKAVKSRKIDDVMKTVQVPWFHEGKRVIKDRDELKQEFEKLFEKRDFAGLTFEIKDVASYGSVRTKVNEKERELLDQVVEKEDRVVLITLDSKMKEEKITLLVKERQGKAAVVGLRP
jgi:hypothetical protein